MTDAREQLIASRGAQMFPRLSPEDLARLSRFGVPCSYRAGDVVAIMSNGGFGGIHDKILTALEST